MNKDEMKNKISMTLKDPVLQIGFEVICKQVADLEKENAELKAKNKWYSEQVCNKECAEVWGKLTEAKELIEDMYYRIPASHSDYYKDVMERARQFLKE